MRCQIHPQSSRCIQISISIFLSLFLYLSLTEIVQVRKAGGAHQLNDGAADERDGVDVLVVQVAHHALLQRVRDVARIQERVQHLVKRSPLRALRTSIKCRSSIFFSGINVRCF